MTKFLSNYNLQPGKYKKGRHRFIGSPTSRGVFKCVNFRAAVKWNCFYANVYFWSFSPSFVLTPPTEYWPRFSWLKMSSSNNKLEAWKYYYCNAWITDFFSHTYLTDGIFRQNNVRIRLSAASQLHIFILGWPQSFPSRVFKGLAISTSYV